MSRNGYTEIIPDTDEESTPIVAGRSSRIRSTQSGWWWWLACGAVLGLGLTAVFGMIRRANAPTQRIKIQEVYSSILYRPVCEYYYASGTKPTLIQTSMKEPSQQWTLKECFAARDGKTVVLNEYAAPDAILKVNFSQLAFPDRQDSILGFGGAFTEAAALNYNRLSQHGKDTAMELLFGRSGLGYSLGRVHINSCDFSVKSYSFDETEDDFDLLDFDVGVHHDAQSGMIDMALRATSVFREAWGSTSSTDPDGNFKLYASPWSPPSWMKLPTWVDDPDAVHAKKMTFSAQPNCLREGVGKDSRYAKAWALYFSKYISAYRSLGLPFWAVTVQNEPEFPAPWEACSYTPEYEKDFIANHLGPRLRQDHPDVKLFIFDHNKDHINTWAETLLNASSEAAQYADGTAYHWYAGGMDRLLDGALGTPNMHRLQAKLEKLGIKQNHLVLGSESCHCPTTGYAGGDIEVYWSRAERYAHTILADLAAGSHGWVEWNLILDGIGGPNHLGNLCESTILAVPHRAKDVGDSIPPLPDFEPSTPMGNVSIGDGRTLEELNALGFPAKFFDVGLAVQPIYFYMGHISRYVRPGSDVVMGLVNQAPGGKRAFRPQGQKIVGGGMNDLAREGIELTVWPCEGSTRQQFKWNDVNRHIEVFGHDWLGKPTQSCVGRKVDVELMGLRLGDCRTSAGEFEFIPVGGRGSKIFNIVLLNNPKTKGQCLAIDELKNDGGANGPSGGAQVVLGNCDHDSAKWITDRETGEALSTYFKDRNGDSEVCMTTGWPFLQMGAFLTPGGGAPKTVVLLNEARDSANYALQDGDTVLLTGTIPPRSIQTLLID